MPGMKPPQLTTNLMGIEFKSSVLNTQHRNFACGASLVDLGNWEEFQGDFMPVAMEI